MVQTVRFVGLVVFHRAISVQTGQIIVVKVTPELIVAVAHELIENHTTSRVSVFAV